MVRVAPSRVLPRRRLAPSGTRRLRRARPPGERPLRAGATHAVTGLLVLRHGHGDDPATRGAVAPRLDPHGRLRRMIPSGRHRTPTGPAWLPTFAAAPTSTDVGDVLERLAREIRATLPAAALDGPSIGHDTPDPTPGQHVHRRPGLVLAGFSQGAALALAYALARRDGDHADWVRPTHVLGFGTYLLDPDVVDYDPAGASATACWLGHGDEDDVVPVQQGRSAARWLARHDLDVRFCETAGGHAITDAQLDDARDWLHPGD